MKVGFVDEIKVVCSVWIFPAALKGILTLFLRCSCGLSSDVQFTLLRFPSSGLTDASVLVCSGLPEGFGLLCIPFFRSTMSALCWIIPRAMRYCHADLCFVVVLVKVGESGGGGNP